MDEGANPVLVSVIMISIIAVLLVVVVVVLVTIVFRRRTSSKHERYIVDSSACSLSYSIHCQYTLKHSHQKRCD